jgi:CRP-like cAMP-binding protein
MSIHSRNRLLCSLSSQNQDYLIAKCVPVDLPLKTVLYAAEETPHYAYSITSGMASIVTTMEDGESAEVGVVGNEGVIGSIFLLGPTKIATSCFIQLEGTALKIPLTELRNAYRASEEIRDRLLGFVQKQSVTVSQIAGCNSPALSGRAARPLVANGARSNPIRSAQLHSGVSCNDVGCTADNRDPYSRCSPTS